LPSHLKRSPVQDRMAAGGFPNEWVDARNQKTAGSAVRRTQDVEVGSLDDGVAGQHGPGWGDFASESRIPGLDRAERVISVNSIAARRQRRGRQERFGECQWASSGANNRFGFGEWRLPHKLSGDRCVGRAVVADTVSAAEYSALRDPIRDTDARRDVVRVR